eukprot:216227-Chlamydomonas_euryale.AAC.5
MDDDAARVSRNMVEYKVTLGFKAQGLGFRAQGSGFRGSGLRVSGSGFIAQGSGFRVQGSRFTAKGSGLRAKGLGPDRVARVPFARCAKQDVRAFLKPWTQNPILGPTTLTLNPKTLT